LPDPDVPVFPVVDREARDVIQALIHSATERIDMYQYEFVQSGSVADIRDALFVAAARGVQVRVFLDQEPDVNEAAVETLKAGGIDARIDGVSTRLHLKVVSVDRRAILLGSTNMSGASLDFNHESNVLVQDPEVVSWLNAYMDAVWADPNHEPNGVPGGSGATRAWSDGGYLALALPALSNASERIDLILYGINLSPQYPDGPVMQLVNAVQDAADRGVTVRVIFERSDWNEVLTELNEEAAQAFQKHGIEVRFDSLNTVTHCKLLRVDDEMFIGSNNWSYKGLALDHEVGVRFQEPSAVESLSAYFEMIWAEAD
jgi:phosphatidylserine/phosphatidylglycerophosphate/cardiolipin synthase-like enzyme